MSNYEKPVVVMAEESTEASAGADACQECSKSGGKRATPLPGEESARRDDFKSCVDNMPIKQ